MLSRSTPASVRGATEEDLLRIVSRAEAAEKLADCKTADTPIAAKQATGKTTDTPRPTVLQMVLKNASPFVTKTARPNGGGSLSGLQCSDHSSPAALADEPNPVSKHAVGVAVLGTRGAAPSAGADGAPRLSRACLESSLDDEPLFPDGVPVEEPPGSNQGAGGAAQRGVIAEGCESVGSRVLPIRKEAKTLALETVKRVPALKMALRRR